MIDLLTIGWGQSRAVVGSFRPARFSVNAIYMPPSINVNAKKRGRPVTTGTGKVVGVRLLPHQLAALDRWIEVQPEPRPTRPEALRRLAELTLERGS